MQQKYNELVQPALNSFALLQLGERSFRSRNSLCISSCGIKSGPATFAITIRPLIRPIFAVWLSINGRDRLRRQTPDPRKDESALLMPLRVSLTLLSIYQLHVSTL